MSFANYWARKLRANSGLRDIFPFRMLPETFKKELQKAYGAGHRDGAKMVKQLSDLAGQGGEIDELRKAAGL